MGKAQSAALTFVAGLLMKKGINYPFDYVLYPVVMLWLGNAIGGALMIVLSAVINILIIRAYDWSKVDWLLIEKIKEVGNGDQSGIMARVLKLVSKSKTLTFLVLCYDDPVTVTLFFREGAHQYNGMSRRDWKIFLAATIVSNLYWIIGWAAVLESGTWFIHTFLNH